MSKFFEGLDDAPQKKVSAAIAGRSEYNEESSEEKQAISNKEKKDIEIGKLCKETSFKKPKDVEQFFKKLSKYSTHLTKKGLSQDLLTFFSEVEEKKETPGIFKQKKNKFLEKYQETEIVLDTVEETKQKKKYIDEIVKTYLIENLEKRKDTLLEIEEVPDLSTAERHRVNLYVISCMVEIGVQLNYSEIVRRLKEEIVLATEEEEKEILCTRIGKYVRKLLKHIQVLEKNKIDWESEYEDIKEIGRILKPITTVPEEGAIEIEFFLQTGEKKESAYLEYDHFLKVDKVRSLPYKEALSLYESFGVDKTEKAEEERTTANICLFKSAEELGHRAIQERDFNSAISLLEISYYNKTIWSNPATENILHILCICFEERMRKRKFFEVFRRNLFQIGDNLLLLKSQDVKMEIARAFIFLQLGNYPAAEKILNSVLPGFECENILRTRAMEILLAPQE